MTAADSEARARYLALALDARKILDAIVPFVQSGERNQSLESSLRDAIDALNSVAHGTDPVHSSLAFDEYEQVLTLDEIQIDRQAVIDDLRYIEGNDSEESRSAALRVLEFFFALESRALQHYNRPPALTAYV